MGGSGAEPSHPTSMPLKAELKKQELHFPQTPLRGQLGRHHRPCLPPANFRLWIQQPRRQKPYLPHLSLGVLCVYLLWLLFGDSLKSPGSYAFKRPGHKSNCSPRICLVLQLPYETNFLISQSSPLHAPAQVPPHLLPFRLREDHLLCWTEGLISRPQRAHSASV